MAEQKKPFLQSLQVLRFMAASLVLVGHVQHEVADLKISGSGTFQEFTPVVWGAGVDIFFVISGFIIYLLTHKHFAERGYAGEFLKRRLIRVAPAYWVFTTLMLAAMTVFHSRISHNGVDPVHVLASYAFLPWPRADGDLMPILSLGWTLNYEMLFYLLFASVLALPRNRAMMVLSGIFILGVAVNRWVPEPLWALRFWTKPIVLEFLMGIGLAHLYLSGVRVSTRVGATMFVVSLAVMVGVKAAGLETLWPRPLWAGLPALLTCAGLVLATELGAGSRLYGALAHGGDISYSLYLSHGFTVNVVALFWQKLGLHMPWIFVLVASLASLVVAELAYRFCEQPILAFLHSRTQFRPALVQSPT